MSTKPTTLARSMTLNGIARPRSFSGERPEDVAAVEAAGTGNRFDDGERQRDQAEDEDRLLDVDVEPRGASSRRTRRRRRPRSRASGL
jgi:hypothetical protein